MEKIQSSGDKRVLHLQPTRKDGELVTSYRICMNGHMDMLINAMGGEKSDQLAELLREANEIMNIDRSVFQNADRDRVRGGK